MKDKKRLKTKILVTYGPACDDKQIISKMLDLGVRAFRFNMKHNTCEWHGQRIAKVREVAKEKGISVCTVMDLQGPEIRATGGREEFKPGDEVIFAAEKPADILLDRKEVIPDIRKGDDVYIDDGKLRFQVVDIREGKAVLRVVEGGKIEGRKSVNLPGVDLNIASLAEKDFDCLNGMQKDDVDYVALSFVRYKNDILDLKKELRKRKMNAGVISKIETQQSLDNFDEILEVSEGIMIARGDLGIETPMEEIPFWQKTIIKKCLRQGKPVITATQMLESMVKEPLPTRAEISDVGNAVLDKTDALMLSGETAMGKYPVEAVSWMVRSALFLEDNDTLNNGHKVKEYPIVDQTAAVTMAAYQLSRDLPELKGFLVLTEGGHTASMLARLRPQMPIYAFTHDENVRDRMYLTWGVKPYLFNYKTLSDKEIKRIVEFLDQKEEKIEKGDKIIMVCGKSWGTPGKTSMIRLLEI